MNDEACIFKNALQIILVSQSLSLPIERLLIVGQNVVQNEDEADGRPVSADSGTVALQMDLCLRQEIDELWLG